MKETYIFDLSDILISLEIDVIRYVVNLDTMPITKHTVQVLKEAWLMDRLEEMQLVSFSLVQKHKVDLGTLYQIKNLANYTKLDQYLYRAVRIPPHCSSMIAQLETRYNDVYIYFQ
jgi:hypothetical protein